MMKDMKLTHKINFEAWSRTLIGFIRHKGLEQELKDWSGGWPCPIGSAIPPPPVQVPVVKALTWIDDDWREARWTAKTPFGDEYGVGKNEGLIDGGKLRRFILWLPEGGKGTSHTSLEAAKAAAQSDYETRIRSALESSAPVKGEDRA
jgi:hypothetical protein